MTLIFISLATEAKALDAKDRYIIILSETGPSSAALSHGLGLEPTSLYSEVFKGFSAKVPAAALFGLSHNPHVLAIIPDRVINAISTQTLPTGVARIGGEFNLTPEGVDADIAIIDTGIDLDHPDLNVVQGVDCRRLNKKTGDCKVGGNDDNGHGSHAAGSAAAINNIIGVAGVAPGARLHAVKVLDSRGSGYLSWIIQGMDWTLRNADVIDVANMSLGGAGFDDTDGGDCNLSNDPEHMAICRLVAAGVTVVVAAGNESDDAANHTPAAFDEPITVSALSDFDGVSGGLGSDSFAFSSCTESADDSFACFSNYGPDVDIMAPGVGIYSTYMNAGYATMSGTSMAAPHVAGAAALLLASDPYLTPADVKYLLQANGDSAPCATIDGICNDDPDGIQEPLLMLARPEPDCLVDLDCDDSNPCTIDTCADGYCQVAPVSDDSACGLGGLCCGGECIAPLCDSDLQCDDADMCTMDFCVNPGTCGASCEAQAPACSETLDQCCPAGCDGTTDADCPMDLCGDGFCAGAAAGEDCVSCAADCECIGKNCSRGCCGDGKCAKKETVQACPVDCQ
jgi:Subtilase family